MLQRIFRYKRIWLLLLIPAGVLLTLVAKWNNGWVESFHAKYVYPLFANTLGTLLSLAPFSVLEIAVFLLGLLLLFYTGWTVYGITRDRGKWKNRLYRFGLNLIGVLSAGYFCFVLFMGLNYYRAPVSDYLGLEVRESSAEELYDLCALLVNDCNFYRARLEEDEAGAAVLRDSGFYETAAAARDAYKTLSEQIPILKAANVRNKPLLTSRLFSMVLTTGIYIPFESGINVDVPAFTVPATMCHELTHFRGFMREEEANFLGYLACTASERDDFRYSGALMAFEYAFNELYAADKELAQKIVRTCGEGMLRDINAESAYWKPFRDTAISNASNEIYNAYLESNDQESGIRSYGEMVDLLLAYYRNFNKT